MASMSPINTAVGVSGASSSGGSVSPRQTATPKNVAFELLFLDSPQYRARLPMRVQIYPHDTTDSIVTTVKNFYGLYSGPTGSKGVSFEDEHGNTLIARYENFRNNMIVYVRVIEGSPAAPSSYSSHHYHGVPMEEQPYFAGEDYAQRLGQEIPRSNSRSSRRRSRSPGSAQERRSASVSTNGQKGRPRSIKNRSSTQQSHTDSQAESVNGYSSGDGAPGSSSGKSKEQLGTTDISVENIVEGGRRKRAKFESSELPLFAPPQMPAATSNPSVSPARRVEHTRPALPFVQPGQNPFTNPRPMQSPQHHHHHHGMSQSGIYATPVSDNRRTRDSMGYPSSGSGMGILPTPDPTVGSCMSEEDKDVAIQLMRLGEMSNISHGRTSASTLDDTFSGRADVSSSTGATSDGESDSEADYPPARRQKLDISGAARSITQNTEAHFKLMTDSADVSADDADYEEGADDSLTAESDVKSVKAKSTTKHKPLPPFASKPTLPKPVKAPRPANSIKTKKLPAVAGGPMSPASMPPSRKQSITSTGNMGPPGEDDQPDLSTKPRCQRCRKSKKGCDRQRPCGRCRDAGLSADQCVSEDEGNGRKGRYGRHMGVPIKKDEMPAPAQPSLLPAAPIAAATALIADKAKKRKR
ncbi:transcriptional regulatory protein [Paramyrothecium foliicola]|nr:transcriptional regulatory protein [Paramyrothecium foliicola]